MFGVGFEPHILWRYPQNTFPFLCNVHLITYFRAFENRYYHIHLKLLYTTICVMSSSPSTINVLLVDDEPMQMMLTKEALIDADPMLEITAVEF